MFAFATAASAQKVRIETTGFTPPNLSLTADPRVITVCEGAGPAIVQPECSGHLQLSDELSLDHQRRTHQRRRRDGTWDLSGLQPGYYRAYVDIDTGSGDEACQAFSSTAVLVNRCPPPPPRLSQRCHRMSRSGRRGRTADFHFSVTGGSGNVAPTYNWTVSAGRIIDGQGTGTIRVDTTGLAGQT